MSSVWWLYLVGVVRSCLRSRRVCAVGALGEVSGIGLMIWENSSRGV